MTANTNPVIAIGLDAANPHLIEKWMNLGLLPHLDKLRKKGSFGKLSSKIKHHRSETAWCTALTSCSSEKTGYWGPLHYNPTTYQFNDPGYETGGYDYQKYPPFYANLGESYPVIIFDQPQTTLRRDVTGIQILGWGCHVSMTPQISAPENLIDELSQKHGEHPLLNKDGITPAVKGDFERFMKGAKLGIERKVKIIKDLISRGEWSLILTTFSECHSALHVLWHKSQPHTTNWHSPPSISNDPLLEVFQLLDSAIGDIAASLPENSSIIVFSAHSTLANAADLGANVFLPEMLFRWSFPKQYGFGPGTESKLPFSKPRMATQSSWCAEMWQRRYEPNKLKYLARDRVPFKFFHKLKLERLTGKMTPSPLNKDVPLFWLPSTWYQSHWKQMKAFALPSYSDGYIRLNIKGREADGIIAPEDYDTVCNDIIEMLLQVRDARKGERLITDVIRTKRSPYDSDETTSDADIVVLFDEKDCPADVVIHPDLGQIGPMPFNRSGGHNSEGLMFASGPNIPSGGQIIGDIMDISPTILSQMGVNIPEYMEGQPTKIM